MKILYDAGYGNMAPDQFVGLLKDADVTVVMDVRRSDSKGRLRCYDPGIGGGMQKLMENAGFQYLGESFFSNRWDTLQEYQTWLSTEKMKLGIGCWARAIKTATEAVCCLICACGKPFEADGTTPRCHRVLVAEASLAELGDGWSVKHL